MYHCFDPLTHLMQCLIPSHEVWVAKEAAAETLDIKREFSGQLGNGARGMEQKSVVLDSSASNTQKSSALIWI